jgi:hypothetical protein
MRIAALVLSALLLCPGCDPSADDPQVMRDDMSLNSIDAELELAIRASYCQGTTPLRLCLGSTSNCYNIPAACRNADGCFSTTTLKTCTVATDLSGKDHPFVDHPDDWDRIFFRTSAGRSLSLHEVRVTFRYGSHGGALGSQHDFVDRAFASPVTSGAGQPLWLDRFIRERRIQTVEAFAGLPYEELPWMVRQAALDLGQSGLVKYRPWDSSGQNGCDEFYNYFASQYSNNIHLSTSAWDTSFFKSWSTGNGHNALEVDQFIRADRAAKLVFNHDAATGDRVSIDGIFYCGDADCSTVDRRRRFSPNTSTFFIRKNHPSVGNFHVMMLLGPIRDQSASGSVGFDVDIIHKSTVVMANTWNLNHNYINTRIDPTNPASDFRHEFYFGRADHGAMLPVTGGVETGAWRLGPNAGHRATLIAIY